ncbi:MAG: rRNA pseudouridine synthase [Clostridia bacterium]|nr:rRNA pseudouridine synthase [Clostridia bacterium]
MEALHVRLDKLLANMGTGSRRDVKKLIAGRHVKVNGATVTDPGLEVSPESDEVTCRGERVQYKPFVYLMMNKPGGVLSCGDGAPGVKVCADLVGDDYSFYELSPAGRLDADSEGLLILTNDGEFIHNIISPNKKVKKTYYIRTLGELNEKDIEAFKEGLDIGNGEKAKSAELEIIKSEKGASEAIVRISEGKYHQVKRMVKACGKTVTYLKRISVGGVELDPGLAPGEYRELTDDELTKLKNKT